MRFACHLCTATALTVVGALGSAVPSVALDEKAAVEAVRIATERFQDVNVALAEGYIRDPGDHCERAEDVGQPPELGAMGIHFFRPDLLGITTTEPRVNGTGVHTDFDSPSVLIYEPQEDGSLLLVAAENLVFVEAWRAAGNTEPPKLAGRTWDYMVDDPNTSVDEAHRFEPHYDQHVWLIDNPNGPLEPFNTAVTCEHHVGKAH